MRPCLLAGVHRVCVCGRVRVSVCVFVCACSCDFRVMGEKGMGERGRESRTPCFFESFTIPPTERERSQQESKKDGAVCVRACLVHVRVKNGRDRRRSPGARAGAPCTRTLFEQAKKKKNAFSTRALTPQQKHARALFCSPPPPHAHHAFPRPGHHQQASHRAQPPGGGERAAAGFGPTPRRPDARRAPPQARRPASRCWARGRGRRGGHAAAALLLRLRL